MSRILVTGFDYFDKYYINTSGEIARRINGIEIHGYRIHGIILPVSYKQAPKILMNAIESYKPSIIVGLGLAPRADKVIIEIASSNRAHFTIPDVDGYKAFNEPINNSSRSLNNLPFSINTAHPLATELNSFTSVLSKSCLSILFMATISPIIELLF